WYCWKTKPTVRFASSARCLPESLWTGSPNSSYSPAQAWSRRPRMESSVLLPAPDGPITVTNSPGAMSRSMRRSRKICPAPCLIDFSTFRSLIISGISQGGRRGPPAGRRWLAQPPTPPGRRRGAPSVRPQGGHRIHPRGAQRRDRAGEQRDEAEQGRDGDEGERIARLHPVELGGDQLRPRQRRRGAGAEPDGHRAQRAAEHHPHHLAGRGSARQAHADLAVRCATAYEVTP